VNFATHELRTIALLCANPDNPDRDSLTGLRPLVRGVAVSILKKLSPDNYTAHLLTNGADQPPEEGQEIDKVADEFLRFLMGRKSEHDLCAQLGLRLPLG
jgi:hypothetical protein